MISPVIWLCRARLYMLRELLDHLVGVFGGRFHGHHPGDLLAHGRVEKALEQLDLEAGRHDFFQDALGRGKEFVLRLAGRRLLPRPPSGFATFGRPSSLSVRAADKRAQRQQRLDHGRLPAELSNCV